MISNTLYRIGPPDDDFSVNRGAVDARVEDELVVGVLSGNQQDKQNEQLYELHLYNYQLS